MAKHSESSGESGTSVLDRFSDWYHVPVLLAIFTVMVVIRLQPYSNFVRDGDVLFSGNDAWYHLREVNYSVRHWPSTMPFDPWTYFPFGTSTGQFGTLYDQLVATAALVVGLGSPSPELVAKTLVVAPAVFGSLAVVPVYYIGKRLGGRLPALFGAVILMLLPGSFLQRSLAGVADHNGVEPLFQALAVLGLMVAFAVADREKPVWELVVDRDVDGLRPTLLWGTVAGIATALYMWVWPPGVLVVGVLGVFVVVKMASDVANGRSPEPTAFMAAVSMTVTAVMMLVPLQSLSFTPTEFTLLQPLLALVVGYGAAFLAYLARVWERRDLAPEQYPIAVLALALVGFLGMWLVARPVYDQIATNLLRTVGFSAGAQTRTIGEAQPMLSQSILRQQGLDAVGRILTEYGFAFFTGVVAIVWLLAKPLVRQGESRDLGFVVGSLGVVGVIFLLPGVLAGVAGAVGIEPQLLGFALVFAIIAAASILVERDSEELLVTFWAVFITSAAFTQVRFNYYLAVVVAVANAYLLAEILGFLDLRGVTNPLDELEGYQVITIAAVVMLVLAPVLVVPLNVRNTGNPQFDKSATAWDTAEGFGPGAITEWSGSLEWLAENTPAEGAYGGAGNDLDYYGTYDRGDGDYAYPDGSYGVMSWWDYGHWITVRGERIPNANPFQQGATEAANFLLAPEEERAEAVLARQSEEGDETRYVMVDWKMVTAGTADSKFGAPIVFYDEENVSNDAFLRGIYSSDLRSNFVHYDQRYYESMMVRLYLYHGSAREPAPVVVDWDRISAQTTSGETVEVNAAPQGNRSLVRTDFENLSEARAYAEQDGTAQVGGIGPYPEERVPALQHYRLVKVSNSSALNSGAYQRGIIQSSQVTGLSPQVFLPNSPQWVKTFERVPGATVQGSGAPPNATVTASVEMSVPTTNSTFTYYQEARADENGEFTLVLPYSTTEYDQYGLDAGHTNVSVRATGPYRVTTGTQVNESGYIVTYRSNLSVSEGQVVGAVEEPVSVTLERSAFRPQITQNQSNDSGGNQSAVEPLGEPLEATGGDATGSGEVAPGGFAPSLTASPLARVGR